MLLTKEIDVALCSQNIPYYENLGYEIPRVKYKDGKFCVPRGTRIVVDIKDLPKWSNYQVETCCDGCGKIKKMAYSSYNKKLRNDNTIYCITCFNKTKCGENHHNWKPNKTDEERLIERKYPEYKQFVKSVLARDNYTCQCCRNKGHNLIVHHLDSYDWCKEKRTDVANGITMCDTCHKNFHSIYGKGNNTRKQFEEWTNTVIDKLQEYNGVLPTTRKIFDYEEHKTYDSAYEYAKIHHCNQSNVCSCCNHKMINTKYTRKDGKKVEETSIVYTVKGHHLFWLDEYEKITEDEIKQYVDSCVRRNYKKIVCLNTGEIFCPANKVIEKYPNISVQCVVNCCEGKQKYCGMLEDGTSLKWLYYKDYITKTQSEINEILKSAVVKHFRPVICLDTGEKFETASLAANTYNVSSATITNYCRHKRINKKENFPKHWMYYSDFCNLSFQEQNNLLQQYKIHNVSR